MSWNHEVERNNLDRLCDMIINLKKSIFILIYESNIIIISTFSQILSNIFTSEIMNF